MSDETAEHRFPCDNCGTDLRYDPGADRLLCDHCGNSAPVDGGGKTRTLAEQDYAAAIRADLPTWRL